ncbi:SNF1-related protein kinase regulatory subunit beta-2-like isoform X2 [Prosopis cineraria]|uniref:SNF1-related protein kinase regulatory subunit beta-2-like isoform X2 n=1 Tax=Prosopis cineraria TaxID=364024 RepID=UPI00240FD972|nr:SNF1-related protein kinase regulatory subunit beta-2-like isoform X2 [Prosopis cineraria]
MGSNSREIRDSAGTSGVKKLDDSLEHELSNGFSDLMVQDPPCGARASEPSPAPMITSQVSRMAIQRSPGQPARTGLLQNGYLESMVHEQLRRVKFSWNYPGNNVAIAGSWDNWETTKALQRVGQIFVAVKTLPVGIYHYRFIVDGFFTYAPELPWACDDSGYAYNILDLQDYIPENLAKLSGFESPPSPPWSYDNIFLNEEEFDKPPPELPPQMPVTVRDEPSSSTDSHQTFLRPTHLELNHLYVHKTEGEPFVVLRSTSRFQLNYVTTLLYKSLRRET